MWWRLLLFATLSLLTICTTDFVCQNGRCTQCQDGTPDCSIAKSYETLNACHKYCEPDEGSIQFIFDAMNLTVDPCEDFYHYSCGTWKTNAVIPSDRSNINRFSELSRKVEERLRFLLERDAYPTESRSKKLAKIFYKTCMNAESRNTFSAAEFLQQLNQLGSWPMANKDADVSEDSNVFDLHERIANIFFGSVLVPFGVSADDGNSSRHTLTFVEPRANLQREKYLNDSFSDSQANYKTLLKKVSSLVASDSNVELPDDQDDQIEALFNFEKEIAQLTVTAEDERDVLTRYNVMDLKSVKQLLPELDITKMISSRYNNKDVDSVLNDDFQVIVTNKSFHGHFFELLRKTDKKTIVNYLIWSSIERLTHDLNNKYSEIWDEYNRNVSGKASQTPPWKRCVRRTTQIFQHAVGGIYIDMFVNDDVQLSTLELIDKVMEVYDEILETVDWMDYDTRILAKAKLDGIKYNIAFPKYMKNDTELETKYEGLDFDSVQTYYEVTKIIKQWSYEKEGRLLLKPVDRTQFAGEVTDVNAFYNPILNSINFPAGILQSPFFNAKFPIEINLGAIGAVIAHEITHGFDDQGSEFDVDGNLHNWWRNESRLAFNHRAQCFIDQYSDYVVPGINKKNNGKLTLGENIADNGALRMVYKALQLLDPHPAGVNDFTSEQLLFFSWANTWCSKQTVESMEERLLTAKHSPNMFRVNGPLANMPEFSKAFNCKAGSKMNREKKCTMW